MPSEWAAVVAYTCWPDIPVGWTRHMRWGQPHEWPGGVVDDLQWDRARAVDAPEP